MSAFDRRAMMDFVRTQGRRPASELEDIRLEFSERFPGATGEDFWTAIFDHFGDQSAKLWKQIEDSEPAFEAALRARRKREMGGES